jgi:hypothetical protein
MEQCSSSALPWQTGRVSQDTPKRAFRGVSASCHRSSIRLAHLAARTRFTGHAGELGQSVWCSSSMMADPVGSAAVSGHGNRPGLCVARHRRTAAREWEAEGSVWRQRHCASARPAPPVTGTSPVAMYRVRSGNTPCGPQQPCSEADGQGVS